MIKVWDGESKSRQVSRYAAPDADDWKRIIKEVAKTQKVVIENSNVYSNVAGETILVGQPLILESNIQLAGNSFEVIGLSIVNCSIGENCIYITQGRLSLSDWTNIINTNKLVPGKPYFLADVGKLASVVPNSGAIVQVGRAQDEETLSVSIETPIYLT